MSKPGWIVLKAAYSNATGGLAIEGENEHALDPRDRKIMWNIGVHSLQNDGWKRYDWSRTVWTDDRARMTFQRLAGVDVETAGLETINA